MGFARRGSNPLGVVFFVYVVVFVWQRRMVISSVGGFHHWGHYSLVVERQPCKLKVLGSIPSGG